MVSSAEVPLLDADCKVSAEVECIQERESWWNWMWLDWKTALNPLTLIFHG